MTEMASFTTKKHRAIVFADVLTPDECKTLIKYFDASSEKHLVKSSSAQYMRVIMISPEWAAKIWSRIKHLLPRELERGYCNDHFRFSKYEPGGEFKIHRDGVNTDGTPGHSVYTINIFLNDKFSGGETDFLEDIDDGMGLVARAEPKHGRAAIFNREILHRGNKVTVGQKFLLRTDIMIPD